MKTITSKDHEYALGILHDVHAKLTNGALLVITIKSTSRSNMSFTYDVRMYATNKQGEVESWFLNWTYSTLMGMSQNKRGEVRGSGIGIDRAFEVADGFRWLFKKYELDEAFLPRYAGIY